MTIIAIIATAIAWYLGALLGSIINMGTGVSTLFAILTMGTFVLEAIRRKK
jgi:hypothetical protein